MTLEAFAERAGQLAEATREAGRDPGDVPPTWAGIALVGEDAAELARLEHDRARDAAVRWTSGAARSRTCARSGGGSRRPDARWFVCIAAGPADRAALIREALADG